jgi:hypothetical protein
MPAGREDGRELLLPFAIVSAGRIFLVGMLDYRGWPEPPALSTIQGSHLYAIDASGVIPYPFERSNP